MSPTTENLTMLKYVLLAEDMKFLVSMSLPYKYLYGVVFLQWFPMN